MSKEKISDVDLFISCKLKEYRSLNNLTQTDVANDLGVTFQQVQKYENGTNKISISNLVKVACLFQCEIKDFLPSSSNAKISKQKNKDKKTQMLIHYWNEIDNVDFRQTIFDFVKAMSQKY